MISGELRKCWLKIAIWTYGKFRINTLLSTLVQLLHYILKCNYFGMIIVSCLSKLLAFLMRNYFPKRTSGAPLHLFGLNYMMFPLVLTFTELWVVSIAGNAYPSGHLVPSPFLELACAPIVETRFLELALFYSIFHLEYPLVLSRFCYNNNQSTFNFHLLTFLESMSMYGHFTEINRPLRSLDSSLRNNLNFKFIFIVHIGWMEVLERIVQEWRLK